MSRETWLGREAPMAFGPPAKKQHDRTAQFQHAVGIAASAPVGHSVGISDVPNPNCCFGVWGCDCREH